MVKSVLSGVVAPSLSTSRYRLACVVLFVYATNNANCNTTQQSFFYPLYAAITFITFAPVIVLDHCWVQYCTTILRWQLLKSWITVGYSIVPRSVAGNCRSPGGSLLGTILYQDPLLAIVEVLDHCWVQYCTKILRWQ